MRPKRTTSKVNYIRNLFAKEDETLQKIRQNLPEQLLGMQIAPEEGAILQFFVKMINAKKIVELGTLAGYSAIWMARGMSNNGKLYTIEKSSQNAKMAAENINNSDVADKVEIINGDAKEMLVKISPLAPFDLIFIDADKSSYVEYLNWAESNIRQNGLIIGDNTFLFDQVYKTEKKASEHVTKASYNAMRKFNLKLSDSKKYQSIMIPTFEGITVAKKLF